MRLLRAAFVMLPLIAACGGDDDPGDVAAVFPEQGFIGRTTRVAVIGDGTSWDAATTLNFGTGVTVGTVEVASPTAIFADVVVAPDVAAGALDVTVTDGGDTSTLVGAFQVASPIAVEELFATPQGGLGLYSITNLDLLHPFDLTEDEQTGELTALTVTFGETGVSGFIADANEGEIIVQVSADVNATAGLITVTSGAEISIGGELPVVARTATVLTPGTPATGTLGVDGALYEVTLPNAELVNFLIESTSKDADISFALLPASGEWPSAGGGAFSSSNDLIVAAGTKFYISVLDFAGAANPDYTLSTSTVLDLTGITPVAETEANETSATADVGTGTIVYLTADLATDVDVDFFRVTVPAGQIMTVRTTAGSGGFTDTQISIFEDDGTTFVVDDLGADIDGFDVGFGDTVSTAQLTAGDYFIKIEASAFALIFGYAPANDPYDLLVSFAAAP